MGQTRVMHTIRSQKKILSYVFPPHKYGEFCGGRKNKDVRGEKEEGGFTKCGGYSRIFSVALFIKKE